MAKAKNIDAKEEKAHDGEPWYDAHAERWKAVEAKGWLLHSPAAASGKVRLRMERIGTLGKVGVTGEAADHSALLTQLEEVANQ